MLREAHRAEGALRKNSYTSTVGPGWLPEEWPQAGVLREQWERIGIRMGKG